MHMDEPLRKAESVSLAEGRLRSVGGQAEGCYADLIEAYLETNRNGIHPELQVTLSDAVAYYPAGSVPETDNPFVLLLNWRINPLRMHPPPEEGEFHLDDILATHDRVRSKTPWSAYLQQQAAQRNPHIYALGWPLETQIQAPELAMHPLSRFLLKHMAHPYQASLERMRIPKVSLELLDERGMLEASPQYRPFLRPLVATGPQASRLCGNLPLDDRNVSYLDVTGLGIIEKALDIMAEGLTTHYGNRQA